MNAKPSFNDLLEEVGSVSEALRKAKREFLEADAAYDARGTRLAQAVVQQAENYSDPKNRRAKMIQQSARTLAADIKDFDRLRIRLMEHMAFLLLQLESVSVSLTVEAATWPASAAAAAGAPLDIIRSFQGDLSRVQARLVFLAARAVLAGRNVLAAIRAATNLIRLRHGKLEQYLEETLTIDIDAALDSAHDILAAEVREEMYKTILEGAAKVLGVAAETAFPIVKIATIGHELYENLQKIKKRYARGEVDEVLDFSDQVHLENQSVEKDLTLFEVLREALAASVP